MVSDGGQQAVFSGGSLLYGSVGRTDLVSDEDTEPLTHAQYSSVRRLAAEAQPGAALYPTHGFGSFCSSGPASSVHASTLAEQQETNHAFTDADEDHFVRELISNLTTYPSYYAHMAPANRTGPAPADLTVPESVDPAELSRRLADGEWVVDLRHRVAFASSIPIPDSYTADRTELLGRNGSPVSPAALGRSDPRFCGPAAGLDPCPALTVQGGLDAREGGAVTFRPGPEADPTE